MTVTTNPTAQTPGARLSIAQMLGVIRVEFHRARTQRYPLCCLMVAVDGLDAVSNEHGWRGKDLVMRSVYESLKSLTREHGFIGMAVMSGDRIMAVFPNTPPDRMAELGAHLNERARTTKIELGTTPLVPRLSLGASHNLLAETNSSFDGLVERAGRALYLATSGGGDRYVMWRAAEAEIEALRHDLAAQTKSFRAEEALLADESSELGGLQKAALVDKIQKIFSTVTRTSEIESLEKQIIELAVQELYEERRKAVAAQMAEHARQVDNMERRISKLTSLLGVTEEELARVMALKNIDEGVASIYRTVQGLRPDDGHAQAKKAMMSEIFQQNLAFQKRELAGAGT